MKTRWNPRKFRRNMKSLAGGIFVTGTLSVIFSVLFLLTYGPWL